MQRRERKKSLTPEEKYERSVRAKRRFRALVRLIICNLAWLQEVEDDTLGDNVQKNIQLLTRKKGKKSLLTLGEKAMLNKPSQERTEAEKLHLKRIIGNLACFRRYPPEVKNELPAVMYFAYYGANRTIVRQDAVPINMYVVMSGEVVVSVTFYDKLMKEYVTKTVLILNAGNYFGEVSLLHGINRTATCITSEPSEFLYISSEDFDRVLKQTVAGLWTEIQLDMSQFTYFQDWSEIEIRECCILAKKKYYETDDILLSTTIGHLDDIYFITKGTCYIIESVTIETVEFKGLKHYRLVEDVESAPKKIPKRVTSQHTQRGHSAQYLEKRDVKTHFIRIGTFKKLACFNVGERLERRVVVATEPTECLLLPRYFLLDKAASTVKYVEQYLNHHIPTTEKVFQRFLEDNRWKIYKDNLLKGMVEENKIYNNNNIHNVPYSIRLAQDLE